MFVDPGGVYIILLVTLGMVFFLGDPGIKGCNGDLENLENKLRSLFKSSGVWSMEFLGSLARW